MRTIEIGSKVEYRPWGNKRIHSAKIEGIEICRGGEKYGKAVSFCDLSRHHNVVCELSDGHWCYGYQIKTIFIF